MGRVLAWMMVCFMSIGVVEAVVGVVDVDGFVGSGEWAGGLLWERNNGGGQGGSDLLEAFYGLDYGANIYFRLDLAEPNLPEGAFYEVLVDLEEPPSDDPEFYTTPASEYAVVLNLVYEAFNNGGGAGGEVEVLYYDGAGTTGWSVIDSGFWAFGDVLEIGIPKPEGIEKPYIVVSAYIATELGSEGVSGSPRCILAPIPEPGTGSLLGVACTMLLGAIGRLLE